MTAAASRYAKTIALTAAALLAVCVPSALALPADRAYEKVSPEDKGGNDIISGISKIAIDGDAANYSSFAAFSESPGGGILSQYYSERTPTGSPGRSGPPRLLAGGLAMLPVRRLLR